jgi:hydrogenase-4 component B
MELFFFSVMSLVVCGAASLCLASHPHLQRTIGAGGAIAGSLAGLYLAFQVLLSGHAIVWQATWAMPLGSLSITIDPLSAFFLIPLFVLSLLGAIYAIEYLRDGKNGGIQWFFFNLLVSSMALVVGASNGLLFLLAWEIMSLASFFLVLFKHEEKTSQDAAWLYLIATHIGAAFLFLFFFLAGSQAGSLDFSAIEGHLFTPLLSSVLFGAGLIGFGMKAGFVPLHFWLPKAHPAAPSHVSALMSGIMIKMGIYGILRSLTLLGHFQLWWGVALIVLGCASGILGVLLALGQHDLKRLLAYSSVENIGIIALALGAGILGVACNIPQLALFGFCGGLLHVVNHAFFKGLLFFGAGSVLHATGTAQIDRLGGLMKKMPSTAACFLIGSVAICGLPPLNGFVSEFFIYVGGFYGVQRSAVPMGALIALVMASLALIGGLATAGFTKAFGALFLGEPRTPQKAHESGPLMLIPMYVLCALIAAIGLFFWRFAALLAGPIEIVTHTPRDSVTAMLQQFTPSLAGIALGFALFLSMLATIIFVRKRLLRSKTVTRAPTWDCGFIASSPRIQYTASSFTQPITSFFRSVLLPKQEVITTADPFAKGWRFQSLMPDLFLDKVFLPMARLIANLLSKLRWLQGGKVHTYVLYIALTLIALLLWNFVWKK